MSGVKLKCAICKFNPFPGEPKVRNAEYLWEGVSVCERHLQERRAQLFHQNTQPHTPPTRKPTIDVAEIFQPEKPAP